MYIEINHISMITPVFPIFPPDKMDSKEAENEIRNNWKIRSGYNFLNPNINLHRYYNFPKKVLLYQNSENLLEINVR